MSDELFGSFIWPDAVEQAVITTCREWMPEYLAWAERDLGLDPHSLPSIVSWVATSDLTRWPEEGLPSVLVMNTGLADVPAKSGRRDYSATFALGLAVVVTAKDAATSDLLAKRYVALLRAIMLHHPDLGGLAEAVDWVDEGYRALPSRRKAQASGEAVFRVEVPNVITAYAGPQTPREDPYSGPPPDLPTVTKTGVTVEPESLT